MMTTQSGPKYGVCAIGNAIVDIIAPASPEFIASQIEFGMQPGAMSLIDEARAKDLYALMSDVTEMSGGSAGNTMAAYASFGGKGAYIGKVANDKLGEVFTNDTREIGVHFQTTPLVEGPATAQCLILVTEDGARTMNTFLGASVEFAADDIDETLLTDSEIIYLEGYLFDKPAAKDAFFKAAEIAKANNRKLALTLSDPFCVNRHRDDFRKLTENYVDILFANEEEMRALYQIENLDLALDEVRKHVELTAVTCGADGSMIATEDEVIKVDAVQPAQLVDTTGAGDAYAAGFLFGLTENKPLAECGYLGSLAASEVISHYGPRPLVKLASLITKQAA